MVWRILIIVFTYYGCSSSVKQFDTSHSRVYIDPEGVQITELSNPHQLSMLKEIRKIKTKQPHTVYENSKSFNESKKEKIKTWLGLYSGSYKFHVVEKNDSLGSIALKIYGDKNKWKFIRTLNKDVFKKAKRLMVGMKLRYVPPESMDEVINSKNNRLPAAE